MNKTLASALVAGAFAAGSMGTASAMTLYYTAGGGFVQDSQEASFPSPISYSGFRSTLDARNAILDDGDDVWSTFNWGTGVAGTGDSGAVINQVPPFSDHPGTGQNLMGSIETGGAAVDFGYVVHHNESISGSGFGPDSVIVSYNLRLYDDAGMTNQVGTWHGDFYLYFTETLNEEPCSGLNPIGTVCDDFFTYDLITQSYSGDARFQPIISGFYDAPAPGGSYTETFYSGEGLGHTPGYVRFAIPEPASIGLLGLGLLGLGFSRRNGRTRAAAV